MLKFKTVADVSDNVYLTEMGAAQVSPLATRDQISHASDIVDIL